LLNIQTEQAVPIGGIDAVNAIHGPVRGYNASPDVVISGCRGVKQNERVESTSGNGFVRSKNAGLTERACRKSGRELPTIKGSKPEGRPSVAFCPTSPASHYPLTSLVAEGKPVIHIKGSQQPVIDSRNFKLKILAPKGADERFGCVGHSREGEFIGKHRMRGMS
jgi:hypothetical protein